VRQIDQYHSLDERLLASCAFLFAENSLLFLERLRNLNRRTTWQRLAKRLFGMPHLSSSYWQRLYELSEACSVGLSLQVFRDALEAHLFKFLSENATPAQEKALCEKLHLRDWALAQACVRGSTAGWERFLQRFRTELYTSALHLTRDEECARELADSVAGSLFVTAPLAAANSSSKLAGYTGRGSLAGWLRALLTNSYLDQYRRERRFISVEQQGHVLRHLCANEIQNSAELNSHLDEAIQVSLTNCDPEERFLLKAYFFDRWTLQELAEVMRVHESSVSRRLNGLLRRLRRGIYLHFQKIGMNARATEELLRTENLTVTVDLRSLLVRNPLEE
jgi:RNA polymerase sigma-70 factor, ECF subfamily